MLYAGTLDEVKVVFPVGEFHLYAEIHEEAGAYATYDINIKFPTTLVSFILCALKAKKVQKIGEIW